MGVCGSKLKVLHGDSAPSTTPVVRSHWTSLPDENITIDNYALGRTIGRGGFGRVLIAMQRDDLQFIGDGREVKSHDIFAIKAISKHKLLYNNRREESLEIVEQDVSSALMVWTERFVLAGNNNPFLISLSRTFQSNDFIYFVMPCEVGGDLHHYLSQMERLPEPIVRFYACQLIIALEDLHSRFIVYRDIKPLNLLLTSDGNLTLADFGLCRFLHDEENNCISGRGGTRGYRAPEAAAGLHYGFSVDFYGLGVTLYQLVTGRRKVTSLLPYMVPSENDEKANATLTADFKDLIRQLTEPNPEDRLGCELSPKRMAERAKRLGNEADIFVSPTLQQRVNLQKTISKQRKPVKLVSADDDIPRPSSKDEVALHALFEHQHRLFDKEQAQTARGEKVEIKDKWADRSDAEIDIDSGFSWNAVRAHPFFTGVDWKAVRECRVTPPLCPQLNWNKYLRAMLPNIYKAKLPTATNNKSIVLEKLDSSFHELGYTEHYLVDDEADVKLVSDTQRRLFEGFEINENRRSPSYVTRAESARLFMENHKTLVKRLNSLLADTLAQRKSRPRTMSFSVTQNDSPSNATKGLDSVPEPRPADTHRATTKKSGKNSTPSSKTKHKQTLELLPISLGAGSTESKDTVRVLSNQQAETLSSSSSMSVRSDTKTSGRANRTMANNPRSPPRVTKQQQAQVQVVQPVQVQVVQPVPEQQRTQTMQTPVPAQTVPTTPSRTSTQQTPSQPQSPATPSMAPHTPRTKGEDVNGARRKTVPVKRSLELGPVPVSIMLTRNLAAAQHAPALITPTSDARGPAKNGRPVLGHRTETLKKSSSAAPAETTHAHTPTPTPSTALATAPTLTPTPTSFSLSSPEPVPHKQLTQLKQQQPQQPQPSASKSLFAVTESPKTLFNTPSTVSRTVPRRGLMGEETRRKALEQVWMDTQEEKRLQVGFHVNRLFHEQPIVMILETDHTHAGTHATRAHDFPGEAAALNAEEAEELMEAEHPRFLSTANLWREEMLRDMDRYDLPEFAEDRGLPADLARVNTELVDTDANTDTDTDTLVPEAACAAAPFFVAGYSTRPCARSAGLLFRELDNTHRRAIDAQEREAVAALVPVFVPLVAAEEEPTTNALQRRQVHAINVAERRLNYAEVRRTYELDVLPLLGPPERHLRTEDVPNASVARERTGAIARLDL